MYDPLYRLTSANYSTGAFYRYTYDPVGNRLTQESTVFGQMSNVSYQYDSANRLINAGGADYTWDNNGNLLSDGVNAYVYDSANRLISINGTTNYAYNGLGDRVKQNGTTYALDMNTGLTQVLSDGTNTYTYGLSRISQRSTDTEYFLGDALGSVRQLTDDGGAVTLAKSYTPYGESMVSAGSGESAYGFTGEQQDASGLTYLRARYYSAADGRFMSRDTWGGEYNNPMTYNRWAYTSGNPILYTDPTGFSEKVECSYIQFDDLKSFCQVANGLDTDPNTIKARLKFFSRLADYSLGYSLVAGSYGETGEGYWYAGLMLKRFLFGFQGNPPNHGVFRILLQSNTDFAADGGILRATKIKSAVHAGDEAADIKPLLYVFLQNHIQPALANGSCLPYDFIGNVTIASEETWSGRYEPRPHGRGWWGAFGHVRIDATYSNTKIRTGNSGYEISTIVDYFIDDNYGWTHGKKTPFGPPVASPQIEIPHDWELSLVSAGKAYMFDFEIRWRELLDIHLANNFSYFSILGEEPSGCISLVGASTR